MRILVVEDEPTVAAALERGLAAVREYEAEFGEFTDEERAWADAVLDGREAEKPDSLR